MQSNCGGGATGHKGERGDGGAPAAATASPATVARVTPPRPPCPHSSSDDGEPDPSSLISAGTSRRAALPSPSAAATTHRKQRATEGRGLLGPSGGQRRDGAVRGPARAHTTLSDVAEVERAIPPEGSGEWGRDLLEDISLPNDFAFLRPPPSSQPEKLFPVLPSGARRGAPHRPVPSSPPPEVGSHREHHWRGGAGGGFGSFSGSGAGMAPLPLLKLAGLAVKQLSKPLAAQLKK